jgi:hypothetical protein
MKYHKETFFQAADYGIPSHWVVQYYDSEDEYAFPNAEYFKSREDAEEFEKSLLEDQKTDEKSNND